MSRRLETGPTRHHERAAFDFILFCFSFSYLRFWSACFKMAENASHARDLTCPPLVVVYGSNWNLSERRHFCLVCMSTVCFINLASNSKKKKKKKKKY